MSLSPEPVNISLYGKRDFVIKLSWEEIILDYRVGPGVITTVFIRRQKEPNQRRRWCEEGRRGWRDALWRWRKGLQAKEFRQPLETEKGKETDSPLWAFRKNLSYRSPDLTPVKLTEMPTSRAIRINISRFMPLSLRQFVTRNKYGVWRKVCWMKKINEWLWVSEWMNEFKRFWKEPLIYT